MNDIQKHLAKKIGEAADAQRAASHQLATDLVDSILSGFDAGLSREQIITDIAAGFTQGGKR